MPISNLVVWAFIIIAAIIGDVLLLPKWLFSGKGETDVPSSNSSVPGLNGRAFKSIQIDPSLWAARIKNIGKGWLTKLAAIKPSIGSADESTEISSQVRVTSETNTCPPETITGQASHIQIELDLAPGETVHITIESRPKK